ncbi:hypothetical protein ACET3Z_004810 [Daucus carota]
MSLSHASTFSISLLRRGALRRWWSEIRAIDYIGVDVAGVDGDDGANGGGEVDASSARGGVVVVEGCVVELMDVLMLIS